MVPTDARLRPGESAPLLQALIARAADDLGLCVLAIKGPVVALQGLRDERTSADVDVLVHPRDLRRLIGGLAALGWHESVRSTYPAIMRAHSVTLLNDLWPTGIDVHHYFPGFLADAGVVFDALWARHELVTLAGVPVPACDQVGQAAIVALHLLRDSADGNSDALGDLEDRARRLLGPEGVQALVRLAHETDATVTMRPFLVSLGVREQDLGPARDPEALEEWNRGVRAVAAQPWLMLFAQTPVHRWPRTLWHAVMLTDEEILASNQVRRGEASLALLRWHRIRRGAKALPKAVQALKKDGGPDAGL